MPDRKEASSPHDKLIFCFEKQANKKSRNFPLENDPFKQQDETLVSQATDECWGLKNIEQPCKGRQQWFRIQKHLLINTRRQSDFHLL
jgi:hypothetical protein